MDKKIAVAIDGPSGAGKSTMAKEIAKLFNFIYVDTGAMYRTVGLYCLKNNIECKNAESVVKAFPNINIDIKYEDGMQKMFLNGEDVTEDIRKPEVSIAASDVSSLPECREFLLDMQRKFSEKYNVIMDGRDIGTVVLPDADVKIFLTASPEKRAERRLIDLENKGVKTSFEDVLKDMEYRDYQDSHREAAPLKMADDAILVDNSDLDFEESLDVLCSVITQSVL